MPEKPPSRAKGPAAPLRPAATPRPAAPPRPALPTIDVDIDWLEPPAEASGVSIPQESARRDTIPVQPEWLEVDDAPPVEIPAPPAPQRRIPRPGSKTVEEPAAPKPRTTKPSTTSRPPKEGRPSKKPSAPPKRKG